MARKLLKVLSMASKGVKDIDFYSDEMLDALGFSKKVIDDIDDIEMELEQLEFSDNVSEEEIDIVRAVLAYVLIRDSSYDKEDIFGIIFGGGKRLVWH